MEADDRLEGLPAVTRPVRWIPSSLLDLPPLEPVFGLRTPHRIYLQAMPSSRETLRALLQCQPFEISIEVDGDNAPLRHVPVQDVHEPHLTADLGLPWGHYYWIADGLQSDLVGATENPGAAFDGCLKSGRIFVALLSIQSAHDLGTSSTGKPVYLPMGIMS